jgi:hypothetical protein
MEEQVAGCIFDLTAREGIALVIAAGTVGALCLTLPSQIKQRGMGWQLIRFSAIFLSLPLAAILALTSSLTAPAATILAGALGYAFGHSDDGNKPTT